MLSRLVRYPRSGLNKERERLNFSRNNTMKAEKLRNVIHSSNRKIDKTCSDLKNMEAR